ncbi:MAG: serine hydrolase domain-containing protein [Fimbriimonadaceae bacterium]
MILGLLLVLPQSTVAKAIQTYLQTRQEAGGFPAANAAITYTDGRTINFSVGYSDEAKTHPLKPTDRMLSGSIGKTYFAAEFVREWKARGWSLDEPISKWVGKEEWYEWLPSAAILTPRMLLNHSACLPEYFELAGALKLLEADPMRVWTISDRLRPLKGETSKGSPGKDWSYADTHYIVLGGIYEKATGKGFTAETVKHFIEPLKLTGTIPSEKPDLANLIPGYSKPLPPFTMKGAMVVDGKMRMNPQFEWTGGGFANTAESLARWTMLLHTGKATSPEVLAEIQTGIACTLGRNQQYGLGCQIRPTEFGKSYGHSGWFPGYLSDSAYFPDKGIAIAIQFNTDDTAQHKGSTFGYIIGILNEAVKGQ